MLAQNDDPVKLSPNPSSMNIALPSVVLAVVPSNQSPDEHTLVGRFAPSWMGMSDMFMTSDSIVAD